MVENWKEFLRAERRFSPLTCRAYSDDLEAFRVFLDDTDLTAVTFTDLRAYVMSMVERGDSSRSVNRRISSLKSFYKYLLRRGVIVKNPTVKLHALPTQKPLPQFITHTDTTHITRHLLNSTDTDSVIVLLLFSTGIRRAELVSLKVSDVDVSQSFIRVIGKGNKERIVPLGAAMCEILARYLQENIWKSQENSLFLTKQKRSVTEGYVYRLVNKTLTRAGLQGKKSPHVLRHTFATELMNAGAQLRAIQELLGHASLSSTELYTHNSIERLKESYAKAHPRAKS